MEIKKEYVISLAGFVFLISGYIVLKIILNALVESGLYGFTSLSVFLVSFVVLVRYFVNYNMKVKTAKEAAQEVVEEQLKTNTDIFHRTTPEVLKNQIEAHLIKKLNEEKYVLWNKATK